MEPYHLHLQHSINILGWPEFQWKDTMFNNLQWHYITNGWYALRWKDETKDKRYCLVQGKSEYDAVAKALFGPDKLKDKPHISASPKIDGEAAKMPQNRSNDTEEATTPPKYDRFYVAYMTQGEKTLIPEEWKFFELFSSFATAKAFVHEKAQEVVKQYPSKIASPSPSWVESNICRLSTINSSLDYIEWTIRPVENHFEDDALVSLQSTLDLATENKALKQEVEALRQEVAEVQGRNAAAAAYATMWDGGWDYTREALIENLQAIQDLCKKDAKTDRLDEMFRNWQESREYRTKKRIKELGDGLKLIETHHKRDWEEIRNKVNKLLSPESEESETPSKEVKQ